MAAEHGGRIMFIRGNWGTQSDKIGLYNLDGKHNGSWKWKSTFCVKNKHFFLYRSSKGFWLVNDELNDSGCISSTVSSATIPLDLNWKYLMVNRWIENSASEVKSLMDIVVVQGGPEAANERMGHYEADGHYDGFPKYKSTFLWLKKPLFLYRREDVWRIQWEVNKNGWIQSKGKCNNVPLGLKWKFYCNKWYEFTSITVRRLDMYVGDFAHKIIISGHTGSCHGLMGEYLLEGQKNGYPKWVSTIHDAFLFRRETGFWRLESQKFGLLSSYGPGASLPFGLLWYWEKKIDSDWVLDPKIVVWALKSHEFEQKIPEFEQSSESQVDKFTKAKPSHWFTPVKMMMTSTKKKQKEIVETRRRNRWGDGLEDPVSGVKEFFPPTWKPTKELDESLDAMGLTKKEVQQVLADGARCQEMVKQIGISVSADSAAAIYAYTQEEPNVYNKLNAASRGRGNRAKLLLNIYRDYLHHLYNASTTMPNFAGRTYRGITVRLASNKYPVGEVITWHQMSSTTKRITATLPFLRRTASGGLEGTLFVVNVIAGKEIDLFSAFPNEDEVLIPINSFFLVEAKIEGKQMKSNMLKDLSAYNMELLEVFVLKQR